MLDTPATLKLSSLLYDFFTTQYYLGMLVTMGAGVKGVIVSLKPDSHDMDNLTGVHAHHRTTRPQTHQKSPALAIYAWKHQHNEARSYSQQYSAPETLISPDDTHMHSGPGVIEIAPMPASVTKGRLVIAQDS